jgi:hypothetical protein
MTESEADYRMKCPNCGRENPGIRLFCSGCGELLDSEAGTPAPVAAEPDDDVKIYRKAKDPVPAPSAKEPEAQDESEFLDDEPDGETDFFTRRERVRRLYEEDWPELTQKAEPRVRERIFDGHAAEKPKGDGSPYARPNQDARRPPTLAQRRPVRNGRPSTLVPRRDVTLDPERIFTVRGETPFDEDDFDRAPRAPRKTAARRGSTYEEAENQSFFMRHVRGIVGMILLVVTATIVLTWAFTPNAQLVLARLDLAWSPSAYANLGTDAYDAGNYADAGRYFEVALEKDADNVNYAIYAANSYIQNGETSRAAAVLKKLIALKPDNADYYVTLIGLYGGYANLPADAKALVDEGYTRTGDDRLKN